jgi:predicted DNA-binding transcriptional regulator AlpA
MASAIRKPDRAKPKRQFTPRTYTAHTLPAEGYVRLPSILAVFPVSATTWHNGVKDGKFPQPVKLGPRTTAWKVEDIRKLLDGDAS